MIRLYAFTLLPPIFMSIVNIIVVGILGVEAKYGFWEMFRIIWIDYYFTGFLFNIPAWRIHLAALILLGISHIIDEKAEGH